MRHILTFSWYLDEASSRAGRACEIRARIPQKKHGRIHEDVRPYAKNCCCAE